MTLSVEDEQLLRRLGDWLQETRQAAAAVATADQATREADRVDQSDWGTEGGDPAETDGSPALATAPAILEGSATIPPTPEAGLFQLAEEFTALRQELKLQTKSGRNLQEQTEQAVKALNQSLETIRTAETQAVAAAKAAFKPREEALLESYMNLDDALERGRQALETARSKIMRDAAQPLLEQLDADYAKLGWWSRRFSAGYHAGARAAINRHAAAHGDLLNSVLEGYQLIQNRLQKAMKAENLERIPCEGLPVDLNSMTVVEALPEPGKTPGTVLKEVRRGYRWQGQIVRFAEVAVVANRSQ